MPLAEDAAGVRPGLAGDDVHQRRLARAVGADEAAELALLDQRGSAVERLEAVEADGRPTLRSERRVSGRRCRRSRSRPSSPPQAGRATPARGQPPASAHASTSMRRPSTKSHASGTPRVRNALRPLLQPATAPEDAPTSVPRPPTATQIAISIEFAGAHLAGVDDADLRHVERARERRTASPTASTRTACSGPGRSRRSAPALGVADRGQHAPELAGHDEAAERGRPPAAASPRARRASRASPASAAGSPGCA